MQPKAYNSDYVPEKPIKYSNEQGKIVSQKFNLLNVVRWRYAEDSPKTNEPLQAEGAGYVQTEQQCRKESNTKVVKWSDGTYSLVVGDEYFDMNFSKCNNEQIYLENADLMIKKNSVDSKCIIKPSVCATRSHNAILKCANEKAKMINPVEKTVTHSSDKKAKKAKSGIDKKLFSNRKRFRTELPKFDDGD